jgi:putative oxidoreductase
MKHLPSIAGALLGLLFIVASVPYFLQVKMEGPPMAQDAITFMTVFASTGYLSFIKAMEFLGAILVAIPRTRNLGLLVLGPIIVNIVAFNGFMNEGAGVFHPMSLTAYLLSLYLLWVERKSWKALVSR